MTKVEEIEEVVAKTPEQIELEKRLEILKTVEGKLKLTAKPRKGDSLKRYWYWGLKVDMAWSVW